MTSLLWYVCLTAAGVGIAVFAMSMKRHVFKISTLAAFYLFTASITWFGEFLVLGAFDSYAYKPGIFADPWAENLVGHLFLNASMFPAAAILMVTYSLDYLGALLIIAAFILAEYLFAKLGIYEQHWWKYYMSFINTSAFLIIVRKWFTKIYPPKYDIPRLLTFYFIGFLIIHTPAPLLLLMGKQYYHLDLISKIVGNIYRSSTIFSFSFHIIEALLLVLFVCVLDKWYWKLVPFVISAVFQSILSRMNILVFMESWKLVYTISIYSLSLVIFILVENYTLRPEKKLQ
jgi:hypothetical protein